MSKPHRPTFVRPPLAVYVTFCRHCGRQRWASDETADLPCGMCKAEEADDE